MIDDDLTPEKCPGCGGAYPDDEPTVGECPEVREACWCCPKCRDYCRDLVDGEAA